MAKTAMKSGFGGKGKSDAKGMGMKKEPGFSSRVGKGAKGFGKNIASPAKDSK